MRHPMLCGLASVLFALLCLALPHAAQAQPSLPFPAVATANANLRAGPGATYARIGGVTAGQALQVTDCNDGCTWYQLDSGAWIVGEVVKPTAASAAPAQPAPAAAVPASQATANGVANLRSGPGTSFARVGSAATGQVLNLTARNEAGDWYQLGDGTWIAAFLVDNAPSSLLVATGVSSVATPVQPQAPTAVPVQRLSEAPVVSSDGNCDPSYPTVCIPSPPPDLDCKQISYRRFQVVGSDPHNFDGDHDGIGCER